MLHTEVCENCPFASNDNCLACQYSNAMQKGWNMWDTMHKLDYIAEDAVVRKESSEMILKFMNEVLKSDEEREYFLRAYIKSLKLEGYREGYQDGYNDAY